MSDSEKTDDVFKSQREIVRYLDALGFKISKSKFSRDKQRGLIKINDDGTISKGQIIEYSATLDRKGDDELPPAELQARKTEREVALLDRKLARADFEMDRDMKKYIPRKDFEAELAARAIVLDSGFRHFFSLKVREIIALVGGKVEKTADLLQTLNEGLDEQLNQYASTDVFQVLFDEEYND
ncbi:MAG TPA: hypothetical protein VJ879_04545 [Desulfobacter sp.]|nr:hypothetical protein [Desulfobacter sp.]